MRCAIDREDQTTDENPIDNYGHREDQKHRREKHRQTLLGQIDAGNAIVKLSTQRHHNGI